jgi:hypothetical protein
LALGSAVRELEAERAWLELVEREGALVIAMARKISEDRQAARAAEETNHA